MSSLVHVISVFFTFFPVTLIYHFFLFLHEEQERYGKLEPLVGEPLHFWGVFKSSVDGPQQQQKQQQQAER